MKGSCSTVWHVKCDRGPHRCAGSLFSVWCLGSRVECFQVHSHFTSSVRCSRSPTSGDTTPCGPVSPYSGRDCVKSLRLSPDDPSNASSFNRCTRTARWSSTLSSKVNLHHAINFRALFGANLVTYHPPKTAPTKPV